MSCKKFRAQVFQYLYGLFSMAIKIQRNLYEGCANSNNVQQFSRVFFYYGWSIRCSIAKEAKNGKVEKLVLVRKRTSWHLLTFEIWSIDDDNVDTRP